ncbi:hypothetical protein [Wolbachia endosymbiont of Trichogramma pretiosum]|uniref:hypothetical protein n=1 Tax=Wolbachia endosymbiont of Trichogramma pretiosum TaxID=125593 RepID=UPI001FE1B11C|nr:hypothetical protein [Wolbachia endosymbiont of Trichogramma pretiosum]
MDRKLKQDEYKTKRQFEEEGYEIVKFYDNELIEDKYCSDKEDLRASLAKLFIFT